MAGGHLTLRGRRGIEPERECSYLELGRACHDLLLLEDWDGPGLEYLLSRGWRHFGPVFFRPRCSQCHECIAIRVPVASFRPTKSQRRALAKASSFQREVQAPKVDDERLALYNRWHLGRESKRGWESSTFSAERYKEELGFNHPTAQEVLFRDPEANGRLVGVGIWDEFPGGSSAVYFYSDPDYSAHSLGVINVLSGIEHQRVRGGRYVYLGFLVRGCASLAYKARYGPHELLRGRPDFDEEPLWELPSNE